jgi:hypothetical protein
LCLDDYFSTTIMPQPTEITQFIFGQPLSGMSLVTPAASIDALLDHPKITSMLLEEEDKIRRRQEREGLPPVAMGSDVAGES